jgi:hypothetical protein
LPFAEKVTTSPGGACRREFPPWELRSLWKGKEAASAQAGALSRWITLGDFMARIVSNVPPGYNMLPELNGYAAHSGPHFWSKDAEGGSLIYGFQSDERHSIRTAFCMAGRS